MRMKLVGKAKPFLKRLGKEIVDDGVTDIGAMMAYYAVLAIFPMIVFVLSIFSVVQHLITNVRVEIAGDEATTVCYLFNPLGYGIEGGKTEMLYCGGLYRDWFVRTADGWRIRERVIETLYLDGKLPGQ